jgi:DNA-binding transcriptional regulator YiaG
MTPTEFRATLRALGLTQRALAERLGLATSTVNRWAKGHADVPQYAVAYLDLVREVKPQSPAGKGSRQLAGDEL